MSGFSRTLSPTAIVVALGPSASRVGKLASARSLPPPRRLAASLGVFRTRGCNATGFSSATDRADRRRRDTSLRPTSGFAPRRHAQKSAPIGPTIAAGPAKAGKSGFKDAVAASTKLLAQAAPPASKRIQDRESEIPSASENQPSEGRVKNTTFYLLAPRTRRLPRAVRSWSRSRMSFEMFLRGLCHFRGSCL